MDEAAQRAAPDRRPSGLAAGIGARSRRAARAAADLLILSLLGAGMASLGAAGRLALP